MLCVGIVLSCNVMITKREKGEWGWGGGGGGSSPPISESGTNLL